MKRFYILLLALCTISLAQAQVGLVRSSGYGAIKKEKVHRTHQLPNAFVGVAGGLGLTVSPHIVYPNGALNFDFGISIVPKVALGGFFQWGILENWALGAQVVAGDYINHKTAFIGGFGMACNHRGASVPYGSTYIHGDSYYDRVYTTTYKRNDTDITRQVAFKSEGAMGVALRLGFMAKNHFYMTADLKIFPQMYKYITDRYERANEVWYGADVVHETAYTLSLSFGYAFAITPKQKNQVKQEAAL